VDDVITVPDTAIAAAVKWLFSEARIVAEPSGATAVAGALAHAGSAASPAGAVVAVVSGGNVEPADYAGYIG
jgi:threonine dehydratase